MHCSTLGASVTRDTCDRCFRDQLDGKHFIKPKPDAAKLVQINSSFGPGDVLAGVIHSLGFQPTTGCGCAAMRAKMNEWGYFGCWQHRSEILAFLKTKANAVGVPFDEATVWSAVVAAFCAMKQKTKGNP